MKSVTLHENANQRQNSSVRTDTQDANTLNRPRSRFAAKPEAGLVLGPRDIALMYDLFLHRVMTRGQIQELHFGSVARCNDRLRQLFDWGYVTRYYLPTAPYGSQALYSLGTAAIPRLRKQLFDQEISIEPEELKVQRCRPSLSLLDHTLAIADIYIAFRLALAEQSDREMVQWLPEKLCREEYEVRQKGQTSSGRWRSEVFSPDAYFRLAFQDSDSDRAVKDYFVEADLGHTNSRQFQGKIRIHMRFWESGLFSQNYDSANFQTLVVTKGQGRLRNLVALCERENSDRFWFTTFAALKADALGPIWHRPFHANTTDLSTRL